MYCAQYANYKKTSKPEINSGERLVETAGYMSAQKRIENMILAGQRLVDYRKNHYDFQDGEIDENFTDPTRSPGFDMADAFQIAEEANYRIKATQTAQEARRREENNKVNTQAVQPENTEKTQ